MLENKTNLQIGPLKYSHVVQKIAIQERKSVDVLETTRSNRNFVVDSGEAMHKAQIRLLFTGLDEINRGAGAPGEESGLRGLIALFRTAPIISVQNRYLNASWKKQDELLREDDGSLSEGSVFFSDITPVALDSIQLENVPDIPFSIQVTLSVSRIEVGPVSSSEVLYYLGEKHKNDPRERPQEAFWLRKWIEQVLDSDEIPELRPTDFDRANFNWYGRTAVGTAITTNRENFHLHLSTSDTTTGGVLISESCSLQHRFAYNKLLGEIFNFPSHMGSTARSMSLDIVFNNQESDETYAQFCRFKETADEISKAKNRFDRVTGWHIQTPISKLLGLKKTSIAEGVPGQKPYEGVYVPINIASENGEQPNMINCRVDLLESNVDFYRENEITLINGGTDYEDLWQYFDKIMDQEFTFRKKLINNNSEALLEIVGRSDEDNYKGYQLFWPVTQGITKIKTASPFGLLNVDTLRAVFLDPEFDTGGRVRDALLNHPLSNGEIVANRTVLFSDKLVENGNIIWSLLAGLEYDDPKTAALIIAIKEVMLSNFIDQAERQPGDIYYMAIKLAEGFLGDAKSFFTTESSSGKVLDRLFKGNFEFLPTFKEALFKVLTERKGKPKLLPQVYSTDGVYTAFYKLVTAYTLEKDATIGLSDARDEYVQDNRNLQGGSLYPDLLLPTYVDLYGEDRWREFAPTIEELGLETYYEGELTAEDLLAVQGADIVSPAAWFYIKRVKNGEIGLKSMARTTASIIDATSPNMHISMPFNTNEIKDIRELIKGDGEEKGVRGSKTNRTLSEIIQESLSAYKESDPSGYRQDLTTLLSNADKFEEGYLKDNGTIKVYLHHNNNYSVPREVDIPGLGAQVFKIASKKRELNTTKLRRLDADASLTTPLEEGIKFHRHLDGNTRKLMDSSLSQIPDDQYSPERMFPSLKVYLIDRRGNDIIADDGLFSVNAVVSVDVTLDKQDAPLAVIKLADPLYTLQNDYFDKSNISKVDSKGNAVPKARQKVLASLRDPEADSNLKRYKLIQGRSIQIRMGYSSMAYNLPIIFTGRITEIVPGDQLTIVAQGWKAELINRQVSFFNDEPDNWGARDLAIQAITYANPEGFGDRYPEHDAQFILRNLRNDDVASAITNAIDNYQNVQLDGVGTTGIAGGVAQYITKTLGLRSVTKKNKGFDTRLKNIWYPDTSLYNNVFGLRSTFGMMPSFLNDSWIIPLQPAWDALQEASRHAWNCIIDVVPYDNEATIFMGHPDQPYYFTRGTSLSKALYNKYRKNSNKDVNKTLNTLFNGFLVSSKFSNEAPDVVEVKIKAAAKHLVERDKWFTNTSRSSSASNAAAILAGIEASSLSAFGSLSEYFRIYKEYVAGTDKAKQSSERNRLAERISAGAVFESAQNSGLPLARLEQVLNSGVSSDFTVLMFSKFFGIDPRRVFIGWPNAQKDIKGVLSSYSNVEDFQKPVEIAIDGLTGRSYYNDRLVEYIDKDLRWINSNRPLVDAASAGSGGVSVVIYSILPTLIYAQSSTSYLDNQGLSSFISRSVQAYSDADIQDPGIKNKESYRSTLVTLKKQIESIQGSEEYTTSESILRELGIPISGKLSGIVKDNIALFKIFVYFFCSYIIENAAATQEIQKITEDNEFKLPPNMKVFRVHHYADDDHNIIQNNIVSTTREMWNTVVIEHPSAGSAEDTVSTEEQLYSQGRINSGANWVYWPKQEVTGVIGLQFHPGLTLANKKIKVFTELNCQSPELAAKLACNHLAQGIRKMYRGNLLLLGKNIKPHDRIILSDKYTQMAGPLEVESVIHHWNANQGWVTNIIPNAVCDANPGAGIMQTAAMEATFQGVFNTIDFVSDALMWATVIATLGAATPLAVGAFSIKQGVLGLAKNLVTKGLRGGTKQVLKANAARLVALKGGAVKTGGALLKRGQTVNALREVFRTAGGPGVALLSNELKIGAAEFGAHMFFKSNVIAGFVESSKDVEQLPVILAPILFNGNPFTSGLETEDSIWAIAAFGVYYSSRNLQRGAALLYDEIFN